MNEKRMFTVMLAVIVGLSCYIVLGGPQPARAGNVSMEKDTIIAGTANILNGKEDIIYIIDTKSKRLAVYRLTADVINLKGTRSYDFDLRFDQWPTKGSRLPKPSPLQMRDLWKKQNVGR